MTDTYNIGIESSMWNGLLGVELDVFYMKTTRSLESQSANFPPSLGSYYPTYINYGSHDNRGFELVLSHNNQIRDFTYRVRGNLSWARNKVLKMTEDANVPDYKRATGGPMGRYWGFVADGLFQSEEEIAHSAVFGPTLPGDIKLKDINADCIVVEFVMIHSIRVLSMLMETLLIIWWKVLGVPIIPMLNIPV